MSAFADGPDHFANWLGAAAAFAPRRAYGAYIEHVVRGARGGLFGPTLQRVRDEAVACQRVGSGWRIELRSNKAMEADALVLALGNAAPAAPPVFEQGGVGLIDPWDRDALKRLPKGDVLLLGAGLTMIDVALSIARRRRKGVIYALSRRGLVPRAHLESATPIPPIALDLPQPLSEALLAFRRQTADAARRGEPWQRAVDSLRARTPELWRRLSPEQQARFVRHLRPWWDVHRHRAAPNIAARVAELRSSGRLQVLAGEIAAVAPSARGVAVDYRARGGAHRSHLRVAGVVNCTGAALDPGVSKDPLMRRLLADGIVRAHPTGLGLDVDVDGRVIGAAGAHPNVFALGPITQGAFWESTAVPEIRVRAAAIAALLAPTV